MTCNHYGEYWYDAGSAHYERQYGKLEPETIRISGSEVHLVKMLGYGHSDFDFDPICYVSVLPASRVVLITRWSLICFKVGVELRRCQYPVSGREFRIPVVGGGFVSVEMTKEYLKERSIVGGAGG